MRIRVHNTLLYLIRLKQINRKLINQIYVYISIDSRKGAKQVKRRKKIKLLAINLSQLPTQQTRIDIFAEIVRSSGLQINITELRYKLLKRGININMKQIEKVLEYYEIKKKLDLN